MGKKYILIAENHSNSFLFDKYHLRFNNHVAECKSKDMEEKLEQTEWFKIGKIQPLQGDKVPTKEDVNRVVSDIVSLKESIPKKSTKPEPNKQPEPDKGLRQKAKKEKPKETKENEEDTA